MILIPLLLGSTCWAADVVFAPKLDDYYGTKVDVKCSIDRGMEVRKNVFSINHMIIRKTIRKTKHTNPAKHSKCQTD